MRATLPWPVPTVPDKSGNGLLHLTEHMIRPHIQRSLAGDIPCTECYPGTFGVCKKTDNTHICYDRDTHTGQCYPGSELCGKNPTNNVPTTSTPQMDLCDGHSCALCKSVCMVKKTNECASCWAKNENNQSCSDCFLKPLPCQTLPLPNSSSICQQIITEADCLVSNIKVEIQK